MVTAPVPVWEIVRDRQCYGPDSDCSMAAGWVGVLGGLSAAFHCHPYTTLLWILQVLWICCALLCILLHGPAPVPRAADSAHENVTKTAGGGQALPHVHSRC